MLNLLLKFEEQLARIEALLLVFFVLLMLGLAVYNVFYRNVMVPVQLHALTEEVAPAAASVEGAPAPPAEPTEAAVAAEDEGFGGGFGGGFEEAPAEADPADGFGGGFGDPAPEAVPVEAVPSEAAPSEAAPAEADAAQGFGGGFGDDAVVAEKAPAADDSGFAGGFGGGFEGEPAPAAVPAPTIDEAPAVVTPEKEMPFIARVVDSMKIEWIDVLLRQLVLVVGFLGATLATRRRKHITIDALSKLLGPSATHKVHILTNLVSLVVCLVLVLAGFEFVAIGLEYPRELMSWAMEWQFQLIFPLGFALLSLHFAIRVVESVYWALGLAEPDPAAVEGALP